MTEAEFEKLEYQNKIIYLSTENERLRDFISKFAKLPIQDADDDRNTIGYITVKIVRLAREILKGGKA